MMNHHDDIVLNPFRKEVGQVSKCRDALIDERKTLGIELFEIEITEDKRELVLAMAEEIVKGLDDTSFENKRHVMDILDVRVVLHCDEKGKWICICCAIPAYNNVIELHPPGRLEIVRAKA